MGRLSDAELSALKQAAEAVEVKGWTHDDCGLVLEADNPDRVVANMGQWWYVNESEMRRRQARTRFIGAADPATVLALVEEVERYRTLDRNSRAFSSGEESGDVVTVTFATPEAANQVRNELLKLARRNG